MSVPVLRASDADREAVVRKLRTHAEEGRLDAEELEDRIGAALRARTSGELDALLEDLPASRRDRPARSSSAGFREHLRVYVAVQLMLVAIWALSGFGYFWVIWPMLGWGIGLVAHAGCGRQPSRRPAG